MVAAICRHCCNGACCKSESLRISLDQQPTSLASAAGSDAGSATFPAHRFVSITVCSNRTNAWRRAWDKAGLPSEDGIQKGVHNLRHTIGRRISGAGVPQETRKALRGHANGDITTHYLRAELSDTAEKVANRRIA